MEPPAPRNAPQRRSPSRPSFQAPTKASLARSHPDILESSLSRSPARKPAQRASKDNLQKDAETRAFGLRDRKALRPSITLGASPSNIPNRSQQSPLTFPSGRLSGLGAFAAPPRRVSKGISASDLFFRSPTTSQKTRIEESMTNTPEDQLASELGSATGAMDFGDIEGPSWHDDFDEPDLPPTPTQLGLERPPGRPKGLLSSSPSMQHAKRGKRRAVGDLEQSPSKLRTVDYGAETEDLTEHVAIMNDDLFPGSVLKKQKLKRELSADLGTLKQDIAKLEGLCEKLDRHEGNIEPHLSDLSSLLISADPSHANSTNLQSNQGTISSFISSLLPFSTKRPPKRVQSSPRLNPFALNHDNQTDSYLSALAPLKLIASSNIISTFKTNSMLEKHQLTLSAPRPFPPNIYKISVSYETNPETQSLVSLSAEIESRTPVYMRKWIDQRLANPLLKLDISGLCWGINRYWEALVSRAQVWAEIEDQHPDLILHNKAVNPAKPSKSDLNKTETLTISDLRRILPQLERTSMLFESKERALKLILTCEITIDEWTGEPDLTPSVCVSSPEFESGSNEKVEQESSKLFHAILTESTDIHSGTAGGSDAQDIINATNCVLNALFEVNGGEPGQGFGKL
ncbi:hypothetical protein BJX99DRAFT_230054 [Aspergillus californicus]